MPRQQRVLAFHPSQRPGPLEVNSRNSLADPMAQFALRPIGVVHRDATDEQVREEEPDLESVVEIYPEFRDGIAGLEGYSHLFVFGYFNKLRPEQIGPLRVRPRRLLRFGLKEEELPVVGVFSLGSPTRPNPVGLSLARLVRIEEGRNLVVRDLEYFDGTPVVDIKPYLSAYRTDEFQVPGWYAELASKAGVQP